MMLALVAHVHALYMNSDGKLHLLTDKATQALTTKKPIMIIFDAHTSNKHALYST